MHDELAARAAAAVLPEIDPLPLAEGQLLPVNRYRKRASRERGLDVRRHVVRAFGVVAVERIALRHQAVQPALEVALRRRIGILLDDEAGRRVAQEERAQAFFD